MIYPAQTTDVPAATARPRRRTRFRLIDQLENAHEFIVGEQLLGQRTAVREEILEKKAVLYEGESAEVVNADDVLNILLVLANMM